MLSPHTRHRIVTVVVVLVVIFLVYFLLWKGRWDAIFPTESDDRAGQKAFQWVAGEKIWHRFRF